ncbi:MAG: glycosyltransferase, partial [bacterium]|nr:glycosyltransferase [bacterium]
MDNSQSRPRVILVTHTLSAGGAERVVTDLAIHLPSFGFDVEVVTLLGSGIFEQELARHGIPVTHFLREGMMGWKTVVHLWRFFKEKRPHVVHTHLFLADTWGRIAGRLARVPVVISTEHNINVSYRFYHHLVNRFLVLITNRFIAVSNTVRRAMIDDGVPDEKVVLIRNGIDLSRFSVRSKRPYHNPPRLIVVGRFFEQKNHALLFDALALVKEPWRLQLVGEGPLERELHLHAERLKISSRIEWLGIRKDVPELLASSDLFCFPSRWEGLGLAVMEASVAGVPIL